MNNVERFHNTEHVIGRISERGLSLEQMKMVVHYPDACRKQYNGRNGGIVYRFEKHFDDKVCVVVAEVKKSECWLITAFTK